MIQKKQLRSTTSFEEEIDTEKTTDETFKGNEVTKKNSKVEVQGTKTKKHGSSVGSTVSAVSSSSTRHSGTKKFMKVVADVHKKDVSDKTQNDSQIMGILTTILENQKKHDEIIGKLSNKVNKIESEFQDCDDYECYDDDQT